MNYNIIYSLPKNTILYCKTRWGKSAYLKKTRANSYKFACIEADGTTKNIYNGYSLRGNETILHAMDDAIGYGSGDYKLVDNAKERANAIALFDRGLEEYVPDPEPFDDTAIDLPEGRVNVTNTLNNAFREVYADHIAQLQVHENALRRDLRRVRERRPATGQVRLRTGSATSTLTSGIPF